MSETGYTTIFLPDDKGVMIHKKGTLTTTTSKPPILQGCKTHGAKLWTVSAQNTNQTNEQELNAYSLPSIHWTINQVLTCRGRLPTQRYVDQINPSRELQHMAIITNRKHSQTLPQIQQNPKGTHEVPTPRCKFNQTTQNDH
jgi:hypothetical protein